ncbi:MAG: NAD(P)-dependent oxidoreductase [Fimbriimonadaceae bacterium]|nr:NAD(P)-dependent oxidoreductase [Fimbriimonadaceae bacterium]
MKLLITGGAGFLGYHVANDLARHGVSAVLYDLEPANLAEYPAGTTAFQGDIRDAARLRSVLQETQPEAIVHGAAALPLWKNEDIVSVNVTGTRTVLQTAQEAGIGRVVQISSTAVYGVPKKHPLEEDDPLQGVGAYGESKIAAEQVCREFREAGLVVPVIRPKTFIGTARLGVFQILYDWVESGCKIPVIGNGRNRYQLLEVTDLVHGIWLLLSQPVEVANDIYNIGAQRFGTVQDDVGALCAYAGSGARVLATHAPSVKLFLRAAELAKLSPLYKWVYGTADTDSFTSTAKIESRLGWTSQYSNAEALIRSYQWYLEHKAAIAGATGVTHRVAWKQGILGTVKRFLKTKPAR